MGRVILCLGTAAKSPYVLQNLGCSVYTVEELCYCIKENVFLMDDTVVCKELVKWLGEECDLPELADSLYPYLRLKSPAGAFLTAILEYVGYYPETEIRAVEQFLKASESQDIYEKNKRIADYLAGSGKYQLAVEKYSQLLEMLPEENTEFRARVLHNIGYADGRLFLFEKAAESFYEAYRLLGEKESLIQYLAAKRMLLNEDEYIDFVAGHTEDYYDVFIELEQKIEELTGQWPGSIQSQELEELLQEKEKHPERYQGILEKKAEQMKEKYRSMIKEK